MDIRAELECFVSRYRCWLWSMKDSVRNIFYDYILYNSSRLFDFKLDYNENNLLTEIENNLDGISLEEVVYVSKFQLFLYSFLRKGVADIYEALKEWLKYIQESYIPNSDYTFPFYFFNNKSILYSLDSYKDNLNKKGLDDETMLDLRIWLEAALIVEYKNESALSIDIFREFLLKYDMENSPVVISYIRRLLQDFNVKGYYGLYGKTIFSGDEAISVAEITFSILLIMYQYLGKYREIDKQIVEFHLK